MKQFALWFGGALGVLWFVALAIPQPARTDRRPPASRTQAARQPREDAENKRTEIETVARQVDAERQRRRDRILDSLEDKGLIKKRTCLGNETQVNLLAWLALDVDGKRNVTTALAQWCADQHSGERMTIIDGQSGRKLAEYSGGSVTVF